MHASSGVKYGYDIYRIIHGIAEGPEIFNNIPLECNLDFLNYIGFSKGCYVGQELIARTKFKVSMIFMSKNHREVLVIVLVEIIC